MGAQGPKAGHPYLMGLGPSSAHPVLNPSSSSLPPRYLNSHSTSSLSYLISGGGTTASVHSFLLHQHVLGQMFLGTSVSALVWTSVEGNVVPTGPQGEGRRQRGRHQIIIRDTAGPQESPNTPHLLSLLVLLTHNSKKH